MSTYSSATLPRVSISRSKVHKPSYVKTSMKIGEITPLLVEEVLPGQTKSQNLSSLIRNLSLIAPVMDRIKIDVYSFFIPNRLTWVHWKEFMGENTSGAGIYSGTEYSIPSVDIFSGTYAGVTSGSVGDYMGLPLVTSAVGKSGKVSCLPIRAYRLVYNRWFRDQNLIAPVTVNTGDTPNVNDCYYVAPFKAAKFSDYFTRALPYAQKGAPVTIPLGSIVPVTGLINIEADGPLKYKTPNSLSAVFVADDDIPASSEESSVSLVGNTGGAPLVSMDPLLYSGGLKGTSASLVADLSQATAATINDLRFAFQYQKLLERDSLYGTRYWEILKGHFGVVAPDASLQDHEFLGHYAQDITVDQIVQTTGVDQVTKADNELGAIGAYSVTGIRNKNIVSKTFVEHGIYMVVGVIRHTQTYGQGIDRMWTRNLRHDFYFPEFANLGAQKVLNKELFAQGTSADNLTFGFQEAWAEYRLPVNKVCGLLRPNAASNLGFYTLANNFGSLPTLSKSFIEQDTNALDRVSSVTGQAQFICDFYFDTVDVLPMPLYSVPGLIDHH